MCKNDKRTVRLASVVYMKPKRMAEIIVAINGAKHRVLRTGEVVHLVGGPRNRLA